MTTEWETLYKTAHHHSLDNRGGSRDTGGIGLPLHVDEVSAEAVDYVIEEAEYLRSGRQLVFCLPADSFQQRPH